MNNVELKAENFSHEKRLSTWNSLGTNVKQSDLRALFKATCPYVVHLSQPYEFARDWHIKHWCTDKCEGYWTDSTIVQAQPLDRAWHFQLESDAALFKLTWS